ASCLDQQCCCMAARCDKLMPTVSPMLTASGQPALPTVSRAPDRAPLTIVGVVRAWVGVHAAVDVVVAELRRPSMRSCSAAQPRDQGAGAAASGLPEAQAQL